ncbi:peptidoglycan-binding domain-containing protein [Segnochrobactraceae bacterium EtOH-i3]
MSEIVIDHTVLTNLFRRNNFRIPGGPLVFFGIRGALPIDYSGTPFKQQQTLRFTNIDNQHMRCTIGQWHPGDKTLAVFPGSTVPSVYNIKKAYAKGGIGANMLMLGLYEYARGVHKPGSPGAHRAFRQNKFFPVWRTSDDLDFDLSDRVDLGSSSGSYFWDNLHCAYHDNLETSGFSSAGCQVVCGQPMSPHRSNKPETGPWKLFVENAYSRSGDQKIFSYGLFSAAETRMTADSPGTEILQSLRFGSTGKLVEQLQKKLKAEKFPIDEINGDFDRSTLECLMAYQRREFGTGQADGIVGPNTAAALGLALPKLSDATASQ